jgi:hypothetical protein
MRYWKNGYCHDQPRLTVRVIAYTLDDPVRNPGGKTYRIITSLLDPDDYPADEIITLYHQRWEIELAIDEIDTHQRLVQTPFRSQIPPSPNLPRLLLGSFQVRKSLKLVKLVVSFGFQM